MAFPFIFESNFEDGSNAEWTSETDVENALNIRHYGFLSRHDVTNIGPIAPWRGAYVLEFDHTVGDAADHVLISSSIAVADTVTRHTRFYVFLGRDLRATADDTFNIFEIQGTANAVENAIGLRITASTGLVEIGVGKVAPTVFATSTLRKGRWYAIELLTTISTIGTGVATLFVDGAQVATVTGLTNTAGLRGVLGSQDMLATTTGHYFVDAFVFDDTRIGPQVNRYPTTIWVTKSMHICLGNSELLNVTLMQGAGVDNVLQIFDTDTANVVDEGNKVAKLYNLTASEPPIDLADVPVWVRRGAFVQLAGTSPQALVHIGRSQGYHSVGRVRQRGGSRRAINFAQE